MGSDPRAGSAVSTNNASNALRTHHRKMENILDDICENGPVLSPELARPTHITKRQVERCIHQLSPNWDDEQLEAVVSMFKAHGLL